MLNAGVDGDVILGLLDKSHIDVFCNKLLDNGADANRVLSELLDRGTASEHLDKLIEAGVNIEDIVAQEELSDIMIHLDNYVKNGIDLNKLVERIKSENRLEHYADKLYKYGVINP